MATVTTMGRQVASHNKAFPSRSTSELLAGSEIHRFDHIIVINKRPSVFHGRQKPLATLARGPIRLFIHHFMSGDLTFIIDAQITGICCDRTTFVNNLYMRRAESRASAAHRRRLEAVKGSGGAHHCKIHILADKHKHKHNLLYASCPNVGMAVGRVSNGIEHLECERREGLRRPWESC